VRRSPSEPMEVAAPDPTPRSPDRSTGLTGACDTGETGGPAK
jgi:hypothetical protein